MRKAVSPVIATLLLILIAVAAAVLVYVWITGYASSVTATGAPELHEQIKIEAVSYANNQLTVYIRNIGDTTVVIDAIYVIHAASGKSLTVVGTTITINPGNMKSTASISVALEEGETYVIKVVTKSGVEASTTFSYRK